MDHNGSRIRNPVQLLSSVCHIYRYFIIVERKAADVSFQAHFSIFVFWGKCWSISVSGIPRYLSPSLQAPRWNPQRSFGQWPRDYIFRRYAGWYCKRGLRPPNLLRITGIACRICSDTIRIETSLFFTFVCKPWCTVYLYTLIEASAISIRDRK